MMELLLMRNGFGAKLTGNPEFAVERISAYRTQNGEPGTLYVGKEPAPQPVQEGRECAYLQIGARPPQSGRPRTAPLTATTKPWNKMALSPDATEIEIAYETLLTLNSWEAALKDALLEGTTIDEFITLGAAIIHRPLAYFDRNLITLATSSDYWERGESPKARTAEERTAQFEGQMPPDMAVDLVEDLDYLKAAEHTEGFYYESAQHRMFYGINTFDDGEYLARLVVSLTKGELHLHRGEEQILDVFHAYLDDLHLRYAGNAQIVSSQNDSLHVLVRTELMGAESPLQDEAAAVLSSFGWAHDDRFIIAKLVFFEGVHWDTVSLYLCSLLERTVNGSCAFPAEQQIVWMINLTRAARPGESHERLIDRITSSLVSVLRNYACKAGLSDEFAPFSNSRSRFTEANRALEMGQIRDPHYWYYRFSDYSFDYLLSQCVDELSPKQTCHPAFEALIAHDAQHVTEYARTLVCFLRNSQNTTHAANELFIHRTSFMRRMAQIQELTGIHLENPDEVLHLLLSAKLMGM